MEEDTDLSNVTVIVWLDIREYRLLQDSHLGKLVFVDRDWCDLFALDTLEFAVGIDPEA